MSNSETKSATLAPQKQPTKADLNMPTREFPTDTFTEYKFNSMKPLKLQRSYGNNMLNTILTSYNHHLPLRLFPDDIQLLVDNIVSKYINEAPETFRHLFVDHAGKKMLMVDMDKKELRDQVDADHSIWDLTMEKWMQLVSENIKDKSFVDNSKCDFSTTTYIDRLCSAAFIQDMTKAYFRFGCTTLCGIPRVYLHGTQEDWQHLLDKTMALAKFLGGNLEKYITEYIRPTLVMFVRTKMGDISDGETKCTGGSDIHTITNAQVVDFWSRIISHKTQYGSGGGTDFAGWIINFFPIIKSGGKHNWSTGMHEPDGTVNIRTNARLEGVPSGITNVPIEFYCGGQLINLSLHAGFHGVQQLTDGSVQVIKGYYFKAVDNKEKTKEK